MADTDTTPSYGDLIACVENDTHLVSTDDDGFCNSCGFQDPFIEDHPWRRSRPTLTEREECAFCDGPRVLHTEEDY